MAIERRAHATWEGDLRSGSGRFGLESSGTIRGQEVTFTSRFEEQAGGKTSPEELIAAAHASCILMALAAGLSRAETPPTRLESEARTTFDKVGEGFAITKMELRIRGEVDGIDEDAFRAAAEEAKAGCPVSNALGGVEISLEASLEGGS